MPNTRGAVWMAAVVAIAAIGFIDYATGIELRVFPLYYIPILLVAWEGARGESLGAAIVCTASWLGTNQLAGMQFAHQGIWIANTLMQGVSFAVVGLLISGLRGALVRERGLSRTDPLTSLLNGRAFYEDGALVLALARRQQWPVTLAYIDLDNFKEVNDLRGHQAGDDVLRHVAAAIRSAIRTSDLAARLGGDEFAVLLPDADGVEAAAALERLRTRLAGCSEDVPVTGSVGAVTFTSAPATMEEMVKAADAQMYAAKDAGKNRLSLHTAGGAAAAAGLLRGDRRRAL